VWVIDRDDFELPRPTRGFFAGAWLYDGVIVISSRYLRNEGLVEHEMLHAALGPKFAVGNGHPPIFRKLGLDAAWLRVGL